MHQTVREFFLRPHDSVVESHFQANLSAQPARSMITITCTRYLDLHYRELVGGIGNTVGGSGFENDTELVRYLNSRPFIKYSLEYLKQREEDVNVDPLILKPFLNQIANPRNCPSSLKFCLLRWLIGFGTGIQHGQIQLNYLLGIAAKNGYHVAAGTLLAAGANCNDSDHCPLHKAAEGGHEATVRLLLDRGADAEAKDADQLSPLHKAASGGHESTARLLLDRGADVEAMGSDRLTALHKAAYCGHEATIRVKLDGGAGIKAGDAHYSKPLHGAAAGGHEATVRLLLDRGARSEEHTSELQSRP